MLFAAKSPSGVASARLSEVHVRKGYDCGADCDCEAEREHENNQDKEPQRRRWGGLSTGGGKCIFVMRNRTSTASRRKLARYYQ